MPRLTLSGGMKSQVGVKKRVLSALRRGRGRVALPEIHGKCGGTWSSIDAHTGNIEQYPRFVAGRVSLLVHVGICEY